MNEYQLPEQILFNYEELKKELQEKISVYETIVYGDEQIKLAKADKANLNKLKKALNDERIRREKEYMQPFNDFKAKINEIIGIIDKPVAVIDRQVKEYEEKQKKDKENKIVEYFVSLPKIPEFETFSIMQIWNEKWVNASVSMKSIQEEINARLEQIKNDLATLANLPEFGFEAQQVYIHSLDLNKALAEGQRMAQIAKAKAEREEAMRKIEEEQKAKTEAAVAQEEQIPGQIEFTDTKSFKECMNPPVEPAKQKQWVSFQAFLSTEDALALREFLNSRGIEFKAV